MPGCAVIGCSNGIRHGFLLRRIPTVPKRRKIWLDAIHRPELMKAVNSRVCEIHFKEDDWEKTRVDGSRKLKMSAVPTLNINTQGRKRTYRPKSESDENLTQVFVVNQEIGDDGASCQSQIEEPENSTDFGDFEEVEFLDEELFSQERIREESENTDEAHERICCENLESCRQLLEKSKETERLLKERIASLEAKCEKAWETKVFNKLFGTDQMKVLAGFSRRCIGWSKETILKAMRLKFTCGDIGYEEIVKQGLPLPSILTMKSKLDSYEFKWGLQKYIFPYLETKFATVKHKHEMDCVVKVKELKYERKHGKYTGGYQSCLVVTLEGVISNWEQLVFCEPVEEDFRVSSLNTLLLSVIKKAESIKFKVVGVNCYQSSHGILSCLSALEVLQDQEFCLFYKNHPLDESRSFHFLVDPFCFWKMLSTEIFDRNIILEFSEAIQEKYQLDYAFLIPEHCNSSMDRYCDSDVLKYVRGDTGIPKDTGTGDTTSDWFIRIAMKWTSIMSFRKINVKFCDEIVLDLESFAEILNNIEVNTNTLWDAIKSGALTCTNSVIKLLQTYLTELGVDEISMSHLTRNCMSEPIVTGSLVESALRHRLKNSTVRQFMKNVS